MWWVLACLGCGVAYWRGSWRWAFIVALMTSWWASHLSAYSLRISQRWDTYQAAFRISLEHPILGVGAGPIALPTLCRLSGMPLPGPHSDLLTLVILHGWPATLLLIGLGVHALRPRRFGLTLVAQSALLSLCLMACGRSMVVVPGFVLMVVACSVWVLKERT